VQYFSLHHLSADGGVMITGSHNPPEFNGFKIARGHQSIYGQDIRSIGDLIEADDFESGSGSVEKAEVIEAYKQAVLSRIELERPVKVVTDSGNGTAGLAAPDLLRALGCELYDLFSQPDGNYPNHHPDPTVPKNLAALIAKVKEVGAEVGLAYDGDADRLGVISPDGEMVWGDRLLALFSRDILSKGPAKVVFEVKCSKVLEEDIAEHGGTPIMWKTGHSLIKEKMKKEGAALAGEMSGHLFFADNYYGYDDAIFASLRLVEILSRSRTGLVEMLAGIPRWPVTPEVRVDCPDEVKFDLVASLAERFKKTNKVIDVDGARIDFGDGWGLVRASNTQPALVFRFEAKSGERLKEIIDSVGDALAEYDPTGGIKLPENLEAV
jgi:phosphomannomutase/phosphoglucomutase